jgi:hypothetical protein
MIRALLLAMLVLAAVPAIAQQAPAPVPFNDRGQLSAAELELQAALKGERISGRVSIPDPAARNLIQPEGRDWRAFHNRTLAWIGGVAVLGMLGLLAASGSTADPPGARWSASRCSSAPTTGWSPAASLCSA